MLQNLFIENYMFLVVTAIFTLKGLIFEWTNTSPFLNSTASAFEHVRKLTSLQVIVLIQLSKFSCTTTLSNGCTALLVK